ncbi:MAG: leucyl aminopeptidase family protein [Glaciecola sp.]
MKLKRIAVLSLSMFGFVFTAKAVHANSQFDFISEAKGEHSTHVILLNDEKNLSGALQNIESVSQGKLSQLIQFNDYVAEKGNVLHLQMVGGVDTLLLIGTKDSDGIDGPELQNLGGKIAAELDAVNANIDAAIHINGLTSNVSTPSAHIAYGYALRDYSYDRYKSEKTNGRSEIALITQNANQAKLQYQNDFAHLVTGIHMARDLATEPGKNMYPQAFVDHVKSKFKGVKHVDIDVLDADDIKKLGMGALAGVGQGSIHDPRLLVINYKGADKSEQPIALVGKGITFDTGGISIKPSNNMWYMKSDLAGAASVAGTMYAMAKRGEKANVVGVMPLAENMPSQDAIRPGDVLETMKGVSIEIMSTDAEGRLILADAVYYAQQQYQPKMLLNIATLTGSAVRALSDEYAAVITRDFALSTNMMDVGKRAGEHVWPLPLHPNHFEQIESPIADIKNSGAGNPGASIGAAVVATFIDEELPWVHLDIAGVDWLEADIDVAPKGSQGWGVRFMDQLVRDNVE